MQNLHLKSNAFAPAELHQLCALQEGCQLHLVNSWHHLRCPEKLLQVVDAKVGYPDVG